MALIQFDSKEEIILFAKSVLKCNFKKDYEYEKNN